MTTEPKAPIVSSNEGGLNKNRRSRRTLKKETPCAHQVLVGEIAAAGEMPKSESVDSVVSGSLSSRNEGVPAAPPANRSVRLPTPGPVRRCQKLRQARGVKRACCLGVGHDRRLSHVAVPGAEAARSLPRTAVTDPVWASSHEPRQARMGLLWSGEAAAELVAGGPDVIGCPAFFSNRGRGLTPANL